jgi:predicted DCC family thiol-disulfide oxidoreductase YuxK
MVQKTPESLDSQGSVLIFDGDCGFCTTVSNFAVKNTKLPVRAEAWQLVDVTKYGVTKDQTAKRVYFIHNGKTYAANQAVAKLLALKNNLFYKTLGYLLQIPPISWIAIPGYYLVAKFRHMLPGGTPACKL